MRIALICFGISVSLLSLYLCCARTEVWVHPSSRQLTIEEPVSAKSRIKEKRYLEPESQKAVPQAIKAVKTN